MTDKQLPPLLMPERIKFQKKIESKKCVFDTLTKLLEKGQSEVTRNEIFDALISREKLGDTYIGNGVAIPRAHIKITNPRAAMLVLKKGLDLNTADKQGIQLFLGILIPHKNKEEFSLKLTEFNKNLLKDKEISKILQSQNAELIAQHFNKLFFS
jgi:PTS system nitrogen regulatory IIA component